MRAEHPFSARWNHNTHYYPLLAGLVPNCARTIVDIGCGDGTLAEYLVKPGRTVVGLDLDRQVLPADPRRRERSAADLRGSTAADPAAYLAGSATELPFGSATIDVVVLVMVLHHADPLRILSEVRRVLRPGGTTLLLGYASSTGPADLPAELLDVLSHRRHRRGKLSWEPCTAKAAPSLSWTATRRLLAEQLPGSSYRRLPMWRYLATWRGQS